MIQFEVLMDNRESPKKCTVHPVADYPGLKIRYFGKAQQISAFSAQTLLHVDGIPFPELVETQKIESIAVIDCVWRRVEPTLKRVKTPLPALARIPDGFLTAYPRRNKKGLDPDQGLATIEAMFIAAAFCGHWDESLLSKYHFAPKFLAMNEAQWQRYKLGPYAK